MSQLHGSNDIKGKVEPTVALVLEIVVHTPDSPIVVLITLLVKHLLIEGLDVRLTWSECENILWIGEGLVCELH